MAQIRAEFQDGKRIVFTARERSFVNVRETRDDGPIGFSSSELLLMALGNCSLGILTNHDLLKDIPLRRATAILESGNSQNPSRFDNINLNIELELEDSSLQNQKDTLERIADNCPVGNTLKFSPEITVKVTLKKPN